MSPSFLLMGWIANIVLQLIYIRATCKVLDIRATLRYGSISMGLMAVSHGMKLLGVFNGFRMIVINPLATTILPLAFSHKTLKTRIVRHCLTLACMTAADIAATTLYSHFIGVIVYPEDFPNVSPEALAASYVVGIVGAFLALELVSAMFSRFENASNSVLAAHTVMLTLCTYIFLSTMVARFVSERSQETIVAPAMLVESCLAIMLVLATLDIAYQDARESQRAADQAALVRQSRHLKNEVLNIASASAATRRLRHDIANQVDVIDELLAEGLTDVACSHLRELQDRAQALTDG